MNNIKSYHAHFYFDERTVIEARNIYKKSKSLVNVSLGNFNEKNVGPHSKWSFMIFFPVEELVQMMPWLTINRDNLSVLVHPLTGNDLLDHTEHAVWFGNKMELNLDVL